jgi:hypothetical protein
MTCHPATPPKISACLSRSQSAFTEFPPAKRLIDSAAISACWRLPEHPATKAVYSALRCASTRDLIQEVACSRHRAHCEMGKALHSTFVDRDSLTLLAERLVREAELSLGGHDPVSAAEQFIRASTYYRVGAFYAPSKDQRRHSYLRLSRQTFHRALVCNPARIEVLSIPFEGATLPGYFVSARNGPSPTLIVLGGFDSSAEELLLWFGKACGARGWNALVFEGPGQPGAMNLDPKLVFRPDYEAPVGAAIDCCLARCDVDPRRIAIMGYSFGGYLAPRAAAMDPRIRAVIANTIGVDIPAAMRIAFAAMETARFGCQCVIRGACQVKHDGALLP